MMASAEISTDLVEAPRKSVSDIFAETATLIQSKFALLVESLNTRRDWLLRKLRSFKLEWEKRTEQHFQTIHKLESMKTGIEALCVKDNQVSHVLDATLKPVLKELKMLREKVERPNIELRCDTQQIIDLINQLGELKIDVVQKSVVILQEEKTETQVSPAVAALNSYRDRHEPTLSIDIPSRYSEKSPHVRSLFFDKTSQSIFVVSDSENVVFIFTSEGKYVSEFGGGFLELPCGIFVVEKHSYVIDEQLCGIYKFQTNKIQPTKKIAGFGFVPMGISGCVLKQRLYVINSAKSTITIFNFSLYVIGHIDVSMYMEHPLEIQLFNDVFFLLSSDVGDFCVHAFSTEGEKLYSLVSRACLQDIGVPRHFSIDPFGNFILSESIDSRIKVFSSGGDFSCAIGDKSVATPNAICFANDKVVSATPNGKIRLY